MRQSLRQIGRYFLVPRPHPRSTHPCPHRHISILWALLMTLLVAGCGDGSTAMFGSGPGPLEYAIMFTAATSYDAALQTVTDLGLQPGLVCHVDTAWQSAGQRAPFAQQHTLVVLPYGAPEDWMGQLAAAPGVVNIVNAFPSYPDQPTPATTSTASATFSPFEPAGSPTVAPYAYACPGISPPATQTPTTLTSSQAGTYVRVAFTSPINTYADALAVAVNLGLPLANPCRDAAAHGTPPPWQSPGQAGMFANAHALVVVVTWEFTSDQWQRQLAQVAGVSDIQAPYAPAC